MKLTKKQLEVVRATGHLLVRGGPGSGKTTVSILRAAKFAGSDLRRGQSILCLGFARATVSRIVEAIDNEQRISPEQKGRIIVSTYHSFFWRIMKTHGYLVGLPRKLSILAPPSEAIALSGIRGDYASTSGQSDAERAEKKAREEAERRRLAYHEGLICFDLFAPFAAAILDGSDRIRKLMATMYPFVILDEFQDTNDEQWSVVQALGQRTTLLALADPKQRIYDWIGADPERLNHFRAAFAPMEIDLGTDNHRSKGTDIAAYGDDLLTGKRRQERYNGVSIRLYEANPGQAKPALVIEAYHARRRLIDAGPTDWSLAILVPTKKMTRIVSDTFRSPPARMPPIRHTAAVDTEGAILAAETIAFLMQPLDDARAFVQFITLLTDYFHGKGGNTPTQRDLKEAQNLMVSYRNWVVARTNGKTIRRNSVLAGILAVYADARALAFTGDPDKDWRATRRVLEEGKCSRLRGLAAETRGVRLLGRGTELRQALSQDWRNSNSYANAHAIMREAFVREHFSTSTKPERGVVVMNMHKAKGKQFDEVIIFEGWPRSQRNRNVANTDRIVRFNERAQINEQTRQNFRVSVTRGKRRTTILTPKTDPCVLLPQ